MNNGKVLNIDYDEWTEHRKEMQNAAEKINELYFLMNRLLINTEHLSKLDVIAEALTDVRSKLVDALVGKEHVPTKTHDLMFAQLAKVNSFNYKVLASVSLGLLMIIIFLLTGEKFNWISPLK